MELLQVEKSRATMGPSERPSKRPRTLEPNAVAQHIRDGSSCPYMDTIDRSALDFDLPPICSVSLQSHNVYICLVCGKYLQGRSPSSHAYAHSLQFRHHLYLGLTAETVFCLPDGYQVKDPSFLDIVSALHPRFSSKEITTLDTVPVRLRLLDGSARMRGVVPLDNLQSIDYANSVFQLLLRISPVRNFLLNKHWGNEDAITAPMRKTNADSLEQSALISALAKLCAKMWSSSAYRAHVAPHELMQEVSKASRGRFGLLKQEDPVQFFAWLVNILVGKNGPNKKFKFPLSFELENCLRGEMCITSFGESGLSKKTSSPFWFLPLDLPPKPLFKDASERTLVPQVTLSKLMMKYNGVNRQHNLKTNHQCSYSITKFPPFLVLVLRRLTKSKFGIEKNPCVVHLPSGGLDLINPDDRRRGKYTLIAAVLHDGNAENGKYRVVLKHIATNIWYELADMEVKETLEQFVSLSSTYMLLYSRNSSEEHSSE